MKRAVSLSDSWRVTWSCFSLMPHRSLSPGWDPTWPGQPLNLRALKGSPCFQSYALSAPCPMLLTQLPKAWKEEVKHVNLQLNIWPMNRVFNQDGFCLFKESTKTTSISFLIKMLDIYLVFFRGNADDLLQSQGFVWYLQAAMSLQIYNAIDRKGKQGMQSTFRIIYILHCCTLSYL